MIKSEVVKNVYSGGGCLMIEFSHVTKSYDGNIGLDDVSINIDSGEFVFLVGPSGAGKSTFIKLILKEIDADSGKITVNGHEVTTMSNRLIPEHRRNIGIVFQDFRLLANKTVFENVAFAMEITHQTPRTIKRQVPPVLSLVGIGDYVDRYPDELSAGEQQRVAIARAIVNRPTVLIADEPTGNLDPDTAWEIMKLLERINEKGTTILMVTHAKDIVDRMNKRVIAIDNGRVIQDEYGKDDYHANLRRAISMEEENGPEEGLGTIGTKPVPAKKTHHDKKRVKADEKKNKQLEKDRIKEDKESQRIAAIKAKEDAKLAAEEQRKEKKKAKRVARGDKNLTHDEVADALAAAAAEAEDEARKEAELAYSGTDKKEGGKD